VAQNRQSDLITRKSYDAIGVEEKKIAGAQLSLGDRHLHRLEQPHGQSADRQRFNRAASATNVAGEMAAIAIFEFARAWIVGGV
jgi:hypothetical protein